MAQTTPAGASQLASDGRTTITPSHASCATPTARSTTVASPSSANCFVAPNRAPPPAATTIAHVRTGSVWRSRGAQRGEAAAPRRIRPWRSRLIVVEAGEDEAADARRHDRRDLQHDFGAAHEVLPVVHDDHRTIFEVADALPFFLAGAGECDADEVAG